MSETIEKKAARITEAEFLAGAYKTCPGRVETKDMKWTKKQIKDGWPETFYGMMELYNYGIIEFHKVMI